MSAASQSLGLAQSQSLSDTDFSSYEDPAKAWIDFVAAIQSGNKDSIQSMFNLAKASHWNHDLWGEATKDPDPDYDGYPSSASETEPYDDDDFYEE